MPQPALGAPRAWSQGKRAHQTCTASLPGAIDRSIELPRAIRVQNSRGALKPQSCQGAECMRRATSFRARRVEDGRRLQARGRARYRLTTTQQKLLKLVLVRLERQGSRRRLLGFGDELVDVQKARLALTRLPSCFSSGGINGCACHCNGRTLQPVVAGGGPTSFQGLSGPRLTSMMPLAAPNPIVPPVVAAVSVAHRETAKGPNKK